MGDADLVLETVIYLEKSNKRSKEQRIRAKTKEQRAKNKE